MAIDLFSYDETPRVVERYYALDGIIRREEGVWKFADQRKTC